MLLALLACVGSDPIDSSPDSEAPATPEGYLALRFDIDSVWHEAMDEPAIGAFTGSFWLKDEVTGAGPIEGAVDLGGIFVDEVDLEAGTPTEVLFTSELLVADKVVVLGFLDSDGNRDLEDPDPDDDDPVTLPADNAFEIVDGETTEVTVFFGLLNP